MAPSVARRRSCSPHRLGTRAVPEQAGSRQSPAPRGLHRRTPSSSNRNSSAYSTKTSTGAGSAYPSSHGFRRGEVESGGSAEPPARQRQQFDAGSPRSAAIEGRNCHLQNQSSRVPSTATPPAGCPRLAYTMYTARTGVPRPPAAGAAGRGRGSRRFGAGEVESLGRSQIASWLL